MTRANNSQTGLRVEIPGSGTLRLTQLLLDFTGTLSLDGTLLPGVADRLQALAGSLHIAVLTADTFGTAKRELAGLPLALHPITNGKDKARFMDGLNCAETAAIGNGHNDVAMLRKAALGIAIIGPEGCSADLVAAARVVTGDILTALDLLRNPLRLKATLRA